MIDPVLISSVTAVLGMIIGYVAKSKCNKFSCLWGMLNFDRDIDAEVEIEEHGWR